MLVTLDDFEARHNDVEADQEDRVTTLLEDASALILDEVEDSDAEWVSTGSGAPTSVVSVTVEVAYRAYSNPDALARAEVGDVRTYWRSGLPADAIYLTEAEKRTVRRAAGVSAFRATTLVTPYSGEPVTWAQRLIGGLGP